MKKIGIVGWSTGENSFGVTKPYLEYFSKFGQVEILTAQKGTRTDLDLVVLPGGMDTDSFRYGRIPGYMNNNPDLYKEYFVKQNLQQYIDIGVPIFGICLGVQQLNVHFGGELTQNMYHEYSTSHRGELTHKVGYPKLEHETGNLLYNEPTNCLIVRTEKQFKVNSLHHQAIHWTQMAEDLEIILIDEDGEYVEALKHKTLPIYGVQFHPEELSESNFSSKIIKELLKSNEKQLQE